MRLKQLTAAVAGSLLTTAISAAPVYQPPGPGLTYGDVSFGQRAFTAMGNPAASAADLDQRGGEANTSIGFSLTGGIEYGNLQDIFDTIDEFSKNVSPTPEDPDAPPGESPGAPPGGDPDEKPPGGIEIPIDPETEALLKSIGEEVATQAAILAFLAVDGYGKAFVSTDIPVVLGQEYLGGAWTFGINLSANTKAYGISDPLDFDPDVARTKLENELASIDAGNLPKDVELSEDVVIAVNLLSGSINLQFQNDSLLLTKAATVSEISTGYSREVYSSPSGKLYAGVEAKFYRVGLSRVGIRFGDITDSGELWNSIQDAKYNYTNRLGVDLGALWVAGRYQLGATLTNINEPKFDYPEIDTSRVENPEILAILDDESTYVMERQLKLEGSFQTPTRKWGINLAVDANAVEDPLGDDYQWFTASAGYSTTSVWVPGFRFGYRKNLAGTEISYVGAGVTVFKYVNIDLASSFDTTKINGTELPRSLLLSIGFSASF